MTRSLYFQTYRTTSCYWNEEQDTEGCSCSLGRRLILNQPPTQSFSEHPSYYLWGLKSAESNLHIFFESTEVENRTILRGRLKTIVTPTKTRFASWLFSISGMSKKLAVIPQLTTRLALLNTLRLTISFFSLMLNRYFFPFFLATWKRDAAKTRRKRRKYSWDKRNVHISAARGG